MKGESAAVVGRIISIILIVSNLISMVFCAFIFAMSLWIIASPSTMVGAINTIGNPVLTVLFPKEELTPGLGVGMAFISIFLFFISYMGFYGALTKSPFLLFMYPTLLILLLMLECALVFYFSTDLMEKGIREQDGMLSHILRLNFKCCEHNASIVESTLPWSCCGVIGYPKNCTAAEVFKENCNTTISKWWERYETAVYSALVVGHVVLCCCAILIRCFGS